MSEMESILTLKRNESMKNGRDEFRRRRRDRAKIGTTVLRNRARSFQDQPRDRAEALSATVLERSTTVLTRVS
ncbi:hypothetical protein L1987_33708 [Smallanthus sonchifolius]|uniref:Uncharacterized protein n=1 Tax=Smallanthus sonchifolius TaxID=185202 RepID=A0ACB9HSM0_9ASTR|nr:hypothetical protein L1987_33708 [Smallanthus sonchifolius]